jgi:hypothetical protein
MDGMDADCRTYGNLLSHQHPFVILLIIQQVVFA